MSFPVREYVAGTVAGFVSGMVGTTLVKMGSRKLLALTPLSSCHRIIASSAIGSTVVDTVAYFIDNSSPFWGGIKFGMGLSAASAYYEAGCEVAVEQIKQKPGGQATLQSERFRNISKQEIGKTALCALVYSIASRSKLTFGFALEPLINFEIGKWSLTQAYQRTTAP